MKKISILCLSLLAGLTVSAQMDLVKDVEAAIKGSSPNYPDAITKIAPALENPESKDKAQTWYVAGKAEYGLYDNLYGKKMIGQDVDVKQMGKALIAGYNYMMTALPLDAVTDAKGKVKTKYTKDIIKTVVGHYDDFDQAARLLWGEEDYQSAYDAWEIYINMPSQEILGKDAPQQEDSIMAEVMYNQALAAWQAEDLEKALAGFDRAKDKGYTKKNLYDYAISVALLSGNNDKMYSLAAEAYPLYGSEDAKYMQLLINQKIENKQYEEADRQLREAIENDPENANQYYNLLGILYESQDDKDKALECYQKSVDLNPEWAQSLYNLGRAKYDLAGQISDNAPSKMDEYEKIRVEQIEPMLKESAELLEKAYSLDPQDMTDAIPYLRIIYYNLNDEENLKRLEDM